jgi:hypothetical protein
MYIEQLQDELQPKPPAVKDEPINLPDPDYTPPMLLTSKRANRKVAGHLSFLKQLTEK